MSPAAKKSAAPLLALILCGLFVPPASSQARPDQRDRCGGPTSATVVFERTWRAVRSSFGAAGMPPPRIQFVPRRQREMAVQGTSQGFRRVLVFEIQREALAGERGCREQLAARESLIHEFVHVFQAEPWLSGELRENEMREEIPEGLAEAEAQWLMWKVYRVPLSAYDAPVWGTYDAYARQARREYPTSLIRRGQFGANWGRDPCEIFWQETNPVLAPA